MCGDGRVEDFRTDLPTVDARIAVSIAAGKGMPAPQINYRPMFAACLGAMREISTTPADQRKLTELIMTTPALRDYSRKLWIRSETALADAIADEIGRQPGDTTARAAARFVLEIPEFAGMDPKPGESLNAVFELLEHGLAAQQNPASAV